MTLQQKTEKLHKLIRSLPDFVIAFSGGVDSGLLAAATVQAGKKPLLLVMLRPPWVPEREYRDATALAEKLDIPLKCIPMTFPEDLRNNPEDRCYLCKKRILGLITETAASAGAGLILDGSNADDDGAHRPGKKALREFGVKSPLQECRFSKEEVRALAKQYNVAVWDKPAYSCLLTRFPHNTVVAESDLSMVEQGEEILIAEGFAAVRLRSHGDSARIEIPPQERERFCTAERMDRISRRLKKLGYRYVSLDLEGYSCGKMDKAGLK